jgi:hypothetical protein
MEAIICIIIITWVTLFSLHFIPCYRLIPLHPMGDIGQQLLLLRFELLRKLSFP